MAMLDQLPRRVRIVEVGPRDGLQNEAAPVPTETKVALVETLAEAGHAHIEVSSFVRADLVPQLADAAEVFRGLRRRDGVVYTALVPNEKGLERALAAGADSIAVFTAASDAFSERNVGCDVATSLARIAPVLARARSLGLRTRAYISTAFVCPFAGEIEPARVLDVLDELRRLGAATISIGDTTGAAHPRAVDRLLDAALTRAHPEDDARPPLSDIALHLHDTYGRALANAVVGLAYGVEEFDTSVAGLGGCPFAPGARGNLDTERLVTMLEAMGVATGIDLERHREAAKAIRTALRRAASGDERLR